MISPFEGIGEQRIVPHGDAAIDMLFRGIQDVGGIAFMSLDEPVLAASPLVTSL